MSRSPLPAGRTLPPSHPSVPQLTRAAQLRAQIADDIIHGVLPPGTPLDETGLAQRFGVSRTPVREALRELSAAGLVRATPHRGAVVTRPAAAEVEDMFAVMAELEALCAGLAAVHMSPAERRSLADLHAALRDLIRTDDPQRYHEVNEQFHQAIYVGSHNAYLAEVTLTTRKRLAPFRRAQFRTAGRLALSHQEHDRVVCAIQRGDTAAAAAAMRDHIGIVHFAYEHYALDQRMDRRWHGMHEPASRPPPDASRQARSAAAPNVADATPRVAASASTGNTRRQVS